MKITRRCLFVVCMVALLSYGVFTLAHRLYPVHHVKEITTYAAEYNLDKDLVYAMIKTESNFNHEAVSGKRATGLMQIMEPTGRWIAEQWGEPFDVSSLSEPETNIRMGCFYIAYLMEMYQGNKKCALAAYNAGHANVDSWLKNKKYSKDGKNLLVIPFPETEKYVNQVIQNEKIYDYLYGDDEK